MRLLGKNTGLILNLILYSAFLIHFRRLQYLRNRVKSDLRQTEGQKQLLD